MNLSDIDEDLMNEIKGMIEVLCHLSLGDKIDIDGSDFYFTVSILRAKYRELLIQLGYVKRGDEYSGMIFDHEEWKKLEAEKEAAKKISGNGKESPVEIRS